MKTIFKILPFLFIMTCFPLFISCSDDNAKEKEEEEEQEEQEEKDYPQLILGTWELRSITGYEIYDGEESSLDDDEDYQSEIGTRTTFKKNGTAIDESDGEEIE